jgi:hypothetical protein
MLTSNDAIVGDLFVDAQDRITSTPVNPRRGFSRWRIEAIQELEDEKGPCVELSVHSSDGVHTMGLNMYVRESLERAA